MRLHTPKLLERYDEMVLLKKLKVITKDVFKSEIDKIYDEQKKIDLRNEKAREAREKQRERERAIEHARLEAIAEAKRAKAKEVKKAKNKIIKNILSKRFIKLNTNKGSSLTLELEEIYSNGIEFEELIKQIIKYSEGQRYIIDLGDGEYFTLNDLTRNRLLKVIKNKLVEAIEHTTSDGLLILILQHATSLTITNLEEKHKNKKSNGAFFKYNHLIINFDLKRYGIYSPDEMANYDDTCLFYALKMGGCDYQILQTLKIFIKNRNIPLCDLEDICQKGKFSIILKKDGNDRHNDRFIYGKEYETIFNIGLIEDHYFLIEDCGITSYALKNYNEIKDIKDFQYIIKKQNDIYKRDKTRTIDSYQAIKIMVEYKNVLLRELSFSNSCIASTQFYDKITNTIDNLKYDEETCCKTSSNKTKNKKVIQYNNLVFDIETYKDEIGRHIPYLIRTYRNTTIGILSKVFEGEKCCLYMLCSLTCNTRLIAHNANYDYRFLIQYLHRIQELSRGSRLIGCSAMFKKLHIEIKDSYHLISMPLSKFSEVFGLPDTKEIMPYDLYSKETIEKRYININYVIENYIDVKDKEQFLNNIKKWNLQKDDTYDIIEYSSRYCEIDCKVLWEGYNTFNKWMKEGVNIDIDNVMTIASLAHQYFINTGCYDSVYSLSGIPQMFIQGCVVGGRTMCSENKKIFIQEHVNDFDAVSLYPSAMFRMDGFLKGKPKVINNLSYDWLKTQDGYFVDILIHSIGKKYNFPLMSSKNDDGIRIFSNDMIGKIIRVDKYTLEDLIEFQEITFDIIRGYYFNEGFNTTIKTTIEFLFNERLKKKKEGNPSQEIYKLIMNSGYGKSIMKPVEDNINIFDDKNEFDVYLSRNYSWIKSFTTFGNKTKVKSVKTLNDHFNIAHVGVCILSMSKRIMNEVMCLSDNNNIQLYYQDTDSIHIKDCDIKKLSELFTEKYDRKLIGKSLGQFHSDFKIDGCKDIIATKSIFLGKKSYIDQLQGIDKDGNKVIDYHIRMKGIPNKVILYTSNKLGYTNPFEMYKDLYNGKSIDFDLTNDGTKPNFDMKKDYSIITKKHFTRTIKF